MSDSKVSVGWLFCLLLLRTGPALAQPESEPPPVEAAPEPEAKPANQSVPEPPDSAAPEPGEPAPQTAEAASTPPKLAPAGQKAPAEKASPADSAAQASTPSPPPAEDEALLAELDAELGETTELGSLSQSRLRLYGFADFTFYKYFIDEDSGFRSVLQTKSAFAVGNLNLYLASNLGSNWNSLAEVRFTYLPHGDRTVENGAVVRKDTSVADYTNFSATSRHTGSIFIERAWLEYMVNALLTVRGGQWLTPYGIWNVDHGSPTIIPVIRPFVIGYSLLPERQTGIQAYGTSYVTESTTLGYALAVSNGRGPIDEYADLDSNKAVTARLSATHQGAGTLEIGSTLYLGRFTDTSESAVVNGAGARIVDSIVEQYDELSIGADVRYRLGGLRFQAEFVGSQRAYTEEGRPLRNDVEFRPDSFDYGAYSVVGYRTNWFGVMPFFMAEYFRFINTFELARPPDPNVVVDLSLGVNARPTANVTLKLQGQAGFFPFDAPAGSAFEHPLGVVQSQAAWAF